MEKFGEIRSMMNSLLDRIGNWLGEAYTPEVRRWLMAAGLRIWAANGLYSESYLHLFNALDDEKSYTAAQMITALDCAGEQQRMLAVPDFFQELAKQDSRSGGGKSRVMADEIGQCLASFALVNGDFTMEEAAALQGILRLLTDHCDRTGVKKGRIPDPHTKKITPLNPESYSQPTQQPESEPAPEAADEEERENKPGFGISITSDSDEIRSLAPGIIQPPKEPVRPAEPETPQQPKDPTEPGVGVSISKPAENVASEETLESVLAELNGLVGLDKVKEDVQNLLNFIRICRLRTERGMKVPTVSYHLVFTGNPGTGKTTVARMVAKLYYMMGLLPSGQLVETDRSGLVAGYVGQTAIKTQKVIQEALGGVLFIDEAYSLANDKEDSFGKEAIETILKAMEDHRNELVVIVAGYDELMHQFIDSNPGLRSRFNKYIHFPDYEGEALLRILERFCDTNGYLLAEETLPVLLEKFDTAYANREEHFGNARSVRNVFEHAINKQASRLVLDSDITNEELATLTLEDILPALEVM